MGDVSLFVSVIYIFMLFIGLLGSHQNIGIGFTLVRYPMFLLSLPLMFSDDSESKSKFS